jgi:hypothetical protein
MASRRVISAGIVVAVVVLLSVYVMSPKRHEGPGTLLDPGWQFYSKPTTLEPPGTVFRIDSADRRFVVDVIATPITIGGELFPKSEQTIQTSASALSRFIGKDPKASLSQKGTRVDTLQFEMLEVQREMTTDADIARILKEFRSRVEYRPDNRYYLIREARSAKELHYTLSEDLVNRLGGSAAVSALASGSAGLSYQKHQRDVLSQVLPERMRVMFLADQIVPGSASLSGDLPEFTTAPVTRPLAWK